MIAGPVSLGWARREWRGKCIPTKQL
jgi:hypothetical protein